MAQPPFPVAASLLPTVVLRGGRVLLSVSFPVIGIAGAPLARAVPAHLAVFGIGGDLLPVVVGAPTPLATRFAANRLARLKLRRLETLLTIATTPVIHWAVVASDTTHGDARFRH